MTGVALALGSAVAHAIWNILSKHMATKGLIALWAFSTVGIVLALPIAGFLVARSGLSILTWEVVAISVASIILHTFYLIGLQYSYKHCDVSATYPISRGLAPAIVAVGAVAVLGQVPTTWQIVGLALMACAVAALYLDGRGGEGPSAARALASGAFVAVTIATYTVFDGWAIVERDVDPILLYTVGGFVQFLVVTAIMGRRLPEGMAFLRSHKRRLSAMAVLVPGSYMLALYATLHVDLSVVTAVRSSSLVWTVVLAAWFLRERVGQWRLIATGSALASLLIITLPAT